MAFLGLEHYRMELRHDLPLVREMVRGQAAANKFEQLSQLVKRRLAIFLFRLGLSSGTQFCQATTHLRQVLFE